MDYIKSGWIGWWNFTRSNQSFGRFQLSNCFGKYICFQKPIIFRTYSVKQRTTKLKPWINWNLLIICIQWISRKFWLITTWELWFAETFKNHTCRQLLFWNKAIMNSDFFIWLLKIFTMSRVANSHRPLGNNLFEKEFVCDPLTSWQKWYASNLSQYVWWHI